MLEVHSSHVLETCTVPRSEPRLLSVCHVEVFSFGACVCLNIGVLEEMAVASRDSCVLSLRACVCWACVHALPCACLCPVGSQCFGPPLCAIRRWPEVGCPGCANRTAGDARARGWCRWSALSAIVLVSAICHTAISFSSLTLICDVNCVFAGHGTVFSARGTSRLRLFLEEEVHLNSLGRSHRATLLCNGSRFSDAGGSPVAGTDCSIPVSEIARLRA